MTTSSHRITIGFPTEKSLQTAIAQLQSQSLPSLTSSVLAANSEAVPKKRTPKSGAIKAAGIGSAMGLISGGAIAAAALNIPNLASIYNNAVPLAVIACLVGAGFGAAAGGLSSFFAGANRKQDSYAQYRLAVEADPEEIKSATTILLEKGGRLL